MFALIPSGSCLAHLVGSINADCLSWSSLCAGHHQKLSIPMEATFRETIQLPKHRPQYHLRHFCIAKAYEWHWYMWDRADKRPQLSTAATGRQIHRRSLLKSCPSVRGKPARDIISLTFSRREEHWGQNRGVGHSPWVLFLVLALNMLHILSHMGSVRACGSEDRH